MIIPPTPRPWDPSPWTWRCHVCRSTYRLGCTRRCLECGHNFCAGIETPRPAHILPNPKRRHRKDRARRRDGACNASFDYAGWARYGTWRRYVGAEAAAKAAYAELTWNQLVLGEDSEEEDSGDELDSFGTYELETLGSTGLRVRKWKRVSKARRADIAKRKEKLYVSGKHDCSVHCDFPSECLHAARNAREQGRAGPWSSQASRPRESTVRTKSRLATVVEVDEEGPSTPTSAASTQQEASSTSSEAQAKEDADDVFELHADPVGGNFSPIRFDDSLPDLTSDDDLDKMLIDFDFDGIPTTLANMDEVNDDEVEDEDLVIFMDEVSEGQNQQAKDEAAQASKLGLFFPSEAVADDMVSTVCASAITNPLPRSLPSFDSILPDGPKASFSSQPNHFSSNAHVTAAAAEASPRPRSLTGGPAATRSALEATTASVEDLAMGHGGISDIDDSSNSLAGWWMKYRQEDQQRLRERNEAREACEAWTSSSSSSSDSSGTGASSLNIDYSGSQERVKTRDKEDDANLAELIRMRNAWMRGGT